MVAFGLIETEKYQRAAISYRKHALHLARKLRKHGGYEVWTASKFELLEFGGEEPVELLLA